MMHVHETGCLQEKSKLRVPLPRRFLPVGMKLVVRADKKAEKVGSLHLAEQAADRLPQITGTIIETTPQVLAYDDRLRPGARVVWGDQFGTRAPLREMPGMVNSDVVIVRVPEEVVCLFVDEDRDETDEEYARRSRDEAEKAENARIFEEEREKQRMK